MAVYKATYCYPLLNGLDIRTAANASTQHPCEWLTCKINSSNKKITGYKIRILDSANNQIFPTPLAYEDGGYISEVSALQAVLPADERGGDLNSGLNGTILEIPFFQNHSQDQRLSDSFNAVYYIPRFQADYYCPESIGNVNVVDNDHFSKVVMIDPFPQELRVGDTVLFPNDLNGAEAGTMCDLGIFQVTGIADDTRIKTYTFSRVAQADSSSLAEQEVVIIKGSDHNKILYFDDNLVVSEITDPSGLWVDVEGHPIDFNINNSSYKWEITLYQGDYVAGRINIGGGTYVYYADYSDLSFEWFDTVLNSGKILGSTNKRIQIASALDDSAILPIGTLNSPLVLQGTYAQLLDSNKNPIASRAYVQNYDTSFGHVYPIAGGFSREDVAAAEQICFYKHSNNVEDILAKERVDCATTSNLNIYQEVDGDWQANANLGLPVIDGYQLKEGSIVLVKDQTRQQENGVYIAHQTGTGWTRSGSYKTWGDFIGAILFVINGNTNGATNWESMASAGGSLFNTDTSSGDSPLIFSPEKPITLFSGRLSKNVDLLREKMPHEEIVAADGDDLLEHTGNTYKVRLYWVGTSPQPWVKTWKIISDGVVYSPGQRVLCYNNSHKIIQIISVEEGERSPGAWLAPDIIVTYTIVDSAETNDYINVLNGSNYGGHVVKLLSSSVLIDDNVKYAYILKNGVDHTYVSPYIGLKEDMALKLLNNQKVTYSDDSESQWIRIKADQNSALKSINTTVWRISHAALAEPLLSDSASDPNIPFTYEVRTYYRASDENSFYLFERPYLVIITSYPYTPVARRLIELDASYCQFQQSSWESYRWILLDSDDNIVQDTGVKYDRDMKVTFYGLNNDNLTTHYKAVLYATDDMRNNLTAEYAFSVKRGLYPASPIQFSAELDCSTHSMLLKLLNAEIPTNGFAVYRREFQKYERTILNRDGTTSIQTKEYRGNWEPVCLQAKQFPFRDFNIKNGHSYQYVLYDTSSDSNRDTFANAVDTGPYQGSAVPIVPQWDEWSLIELKPVENDVDAPILRKSFEVDLDNIWLFKYSLETGNQTQNIQKSEVQTLGQFQKIGYGRMNYISGDVSCLLGSEIVPYSKNGYVERMHRSAGTTAFSSNEKAFMLEQWRKIASSPNPKLLRDMKGQSWIVQIMSSSNSPKNFYYNQPDTISFSWKQIDITDGVVIIGSGEDLPSVGCFDSSPIWEKVL